MASTDDVRYSRYLRRVALWALAIGAATAAAIVATLLNAGQASAQPLIVPAVGTVEASDGFAIPTGIGVLNSVDIPGIAVELTADIPVIQLLESTVSELERPAIADVSEAEIMVSSTASTIPLPATDAILGTELSAPATVLGTQLFAPATVPGAELQTYTTVLGIELPFPVPLPRIELPFLTGIPEIDRAVPAAPAVTPKKTTGEVAIEAARSKLGADYIMGSTGPDSFDCSGLVQWSYEQAGVEVPRTSYDQLAAGTPVSMDELEPGDLVSFYGGGHSALYAGDGQVIHAATEGIGVTMTPISQMPVTGTCRF
jgi:cell wall-associated NlpC family hydrolase